MIDDENQTVFAQEEPMIETGRHEAVGAEAAPVDPNAPVVVKKKLSPIKFALILFGVMCILLLLVATAAKRMPRQQAVSASPSPSAGTTAQQQSDLDTTLKLLDQDVANADPSINDLPVPPINYKLALDAGN